MLSMRRTLLIWLSIGLTVGFVLAAGLMYKQAFDQANQLFDYQLKQLAASLPSHAFSPMDPGRSRVIDPDQDIVIQIWDYTGLRLYYSHGATILPQRAELGFSNLRTPSGTWRVYSAALGDTVVQVAQPMSGRGALAAHIALRTLVPMLLLLPALGALIWVTIGRGLAPVRRLAVEVQSRDASTLAPVSADDVPVEIRPLTEALNDLLRRLDASLGAQRSFVADAAHELRTPLTALRLQLQLAERAGDEMTRRAAFADLHAGLDRATRLVQQLLTLARQEPGAFDLPMHMLDLRALAASVVVNHAHLAAQRDIDLGLQEGNGEPAMMRGNADALQILLGNLIDNAIRHTPGNGRIDVEVATQHDTVVVTVRDTGPGIAADQLDRVFDRFHRVPGTAAPGSGLGLAIVRRIAQSHGGEVRLLNEGGLVARVTFPGSAPVSAGS